MQIKISIVSFDRLTTFTHQALQLNRGCSLVSVNHKSSIGELKKEKKRKTHVQMIRVLTIHA